MKVIFLDIDGVLNSEQLVHRLGMDWDGNQLDPLAIDRLNRLTDESGAKIVISSSWRIAYHWEELVPILQDAGIKAEIIDKTPYLHSDRADEIWCWLDNTQEKIETYVILDDDRLEMKRDNSDPVLDMHFVRTSWLDGLQDRHVDAALQVLNETTHFASKVQHEEEF